jgi:hypothetical protein
MSGSGRGLMDDSFVSENDILLTTDTDDDDESFDEDNDEEDGDNPDSYVGDEDEDGGDDDDDDDNNRHSLSVNNDLIINTLNDFVASNHSNANTENEDLPTYKAKMKVLLEQLMLKLEEDVDYQKNLESQIDELEKELIMKDNLIESLSSHHNKESLSSHAHAADELAEELMIKLNHEKQKRVALEKIVLRLQNEKAKLEVSRVMSSHVN